MNLPDIDTSESLLDEAAELNPGPWHTRDMSPRPGARSPPRMRNWIRIVPTSVDFCTTSDDAPEVPLQNTDAIFGVWDCTAEERAHLDAFILGLTYTPYDHLLQLCDALALASGFVLMEKRMLDVPLRHGTNELTVDKWRATTVSIAAKSRMA